MSRTDQEIVNDWLQRRGARVKLVATAKAEHEAAQHALDAARLSDVHPRAELVLARNQASVKLAKRRAQLAEADRVIARHRDTSHVAAPVDHILTHANGWAGQAAHDGVDLICPPSAILYAICDAEVFDVRSSGWWGKSAQASAGHPITDGDGIIQIRCITDVGPFVPGMHFGYGHAEHAMVKEGQRVKAGQAIGRAGFANAWHTHFMLNDGNTLRGVGTRDPWPLVAYAVAHDD